MDEKRKEQLKQYSLDSSSFENLDKRLKFNETISGFYERLFDEEKMDKYSPENLLGNAGRLRSCSKEWEVGYHKNLKIKELKKTSLCRDKFCVNCQSALAQSRAHRFTPLFEDYLKVGTVYHGTFTVPNCPGHDLKKTVDKMYKCFSMFIKYLNGTKKITGIDFSFLGYSSAVKSFEVSFNDKTGLYHPHLHVLFSFGKDVTLKKVIINKFSFSNKDDKITYFSFEEVLFQKIWFMLFNSIKVTERNVEELEVKDGYSVKFNLATKENFKEVFKYPFKEDLSTEKCLGYEQFKVYRQTLKGRRVVDGYGEARGYNFETDDIEIAELDVEVRELFYDIEQEDPAEDVIESSKEIVENIGKKNDKYVTHESYRRFLLSPEDRLTEESKEILEEFKKKF